MRGFGRLDGDEGFAEVFFDGLFVPDDAVIGAVSQGWKVAMATTSSERGLTLRSPGRFLAATKRLDLLRRQQPVDPARDLRCLDAALKAEAYRVFTEAAVHNMEHGQDLGSRSSLMKVYWSELDIELHETALELLGDDAALEHDWSKAYQFSLPHLRRDQRDPAQNHRRALARLTEALTDGLPP